MLEHEFILNYARTGPALSPIDSGLDWHYILRQAKAHNVAPLLYNNIRNLPVPSPILKEFEKLYTYTAFHNMLYLEELQKILGRINGIVLKGPVLAQDVYRNIGLRPFMDMDILIKKEELDEAKKILYDLGYSTRDENFYKKYHFHMPFTKMGKVPVHLELHWAFVDKFILHRIDMDRVWREANPVRNVISNGAKENKLPGEMNILYLLLHIEKHAFFNKAIYNQGNPRDWLFINPRGNQLIWYTDIYESITKTPINLEGLIAVAKEWRIQNIVYYNLYILNKLYPIPSLEGLPQPRLGLLKRLIYTLASKKLGFKLEPDMQLRPVRAVDLVNYLFPSSDYNCIIQFFTGLREISNEFIGICRQKLFTEKKRESPAAG